ncbi:MULTISPECIES: 4,5-DOPA dioxygenase extradiol [unclassified Luteimonas]|uniref:4,5-DOPA-extradiol-dioxygenase n=1 Tax=unclassified Luteimonas TaxID=2629088 RepID=UPI001F43F205|nr:MULTISPECIES: 4,5-DOPA dioxygenase extradiol [unclassified Luteimonas]
MAIQPLMPAAFLGHGSPMNALERNRFTEAWRAFGAAVPRPRAILAVSAHWYVNATAVTAMPRPRTIHDFYGFPRPLFEVDYPAPGLPELAEEVADVAKPDFVGPDHDGWGLDHGTWSVLVHAFPDADIPVVQLSINAQKPPDWHVALGARLAALRERGVLVVGSGNVVHNLRAMDWRQPDAGFDWNERFDAHAQQLLAERPGDAAGLATHRDYAASAPTPEHFLPLLYLAGMAAAAGNGADVLVEGPAYGSLSMTSYTVGAPCPPPSEVEDGAAPPSTIVPADASNL